MHNSQKCSHVFVLKKPNISFNHDAMNTSLMMCVIPHKDINLLVVNLLSLPPFIL